jgi:hypothetical protein
MAAQGGKNLAKAVSLHTDRKAFHVTKFSLIVLFEFEQKIHCLCSFKSNELLLR